MDTPLKVGQMHGVSSATDSARFCMHASLQATVRVSKLAPEVTLLLAKPLRISTFVQTGANGGPLHRSSYRRSHSRIKTNRSPGSRPLRGVSQRLACSFRSQRLDWINRRRATRQRIAGEHGRRRERDGHCGERDRIKGRACASRPLLNDRRTVRTVRTQKIGIPPSRSGRLSHGGGQKLGNAHRGDRCASR